MDDTPRRTAVVEFAGARGGVAPLSWGQASIWRLTTWRPDGDPYFNMPWTLPVYGRRDLDSVLLALRRLFERHESLRTNFRRTPGGMVQHVAREGRLTVRLVDGGPAKPLTTARRLAADLASTAFDYETALPVRCAIVTIGGRPRAVAFGLSHLAADGGALDLLAADWRSLLAGNDPPEPTWQPMDQATFEREGPGAVRGERAFQYWRATLEKAPRSLFDYPPYAPESPRYIRVLMNSVALGVAAETLAARWSVSAASVLTTASAVLLSALTGHRRIVMQLIGANRHDPRIGVLMGPAAQDGIFALDLPGGTLAEVTRIGHRQALTAYRHAHYEPLGLMAMREELGRERGGPIDLSAYFNDTRSGGEWPELPTVEPSGDPAAIAALTGRTTFAPAGSWDHVDATAQFVTGQARHTCELHLLADTAYLPRPTVHTLLRGMETLLVRAVAEDVPLDAVAGLCGITPIERPPGWERSQTGPAGDTEQAPATSGPVVAEVAGG
ncbi:condensation domain-containing protein [Streptosporangium lutulentum]|uniref:Condensation domain-containing protein n=1 Tax=Streptosporangium lutulentum TaxID=1461250 RepID=A0ABT9Q7L3_9ACTN|nr:condensation domain-containing protein [Streptosporangium lutulentum]MDP9842712.1 hypothetical protein [Streptosporangium lutulentum]